MVDGVALGTGQSAQLLVEEELKLEPEPAAILHLRTEELIAKEKAQRLKTAILINAWVRYYNILCDWLLKSLLLGHLEWYDGYQLAFIGVWLRVDGHHFAL